VSEATCSVEGCLRRVIARGLCRLHYNRWRQAHPNPEDRPRPTRKPKPPKPACSVEGCTAPTYARDVCTSHYRRLRLYGSATGSPPPPTNGTLCSVEGCTKLVSGRGLCGMHYQRWRIYGSTADRPRSGRGGNGPRLGRPVTRPSIVFLGVRYFRKDNGHWRSSKTNDRPADELHRVVYQHCIGPIPAGFHIHHIDGNPDNNEPSNLEALSTVGHRHAHSPVRPAVCDNCGRQFMTRGPSMGPATSRWCSADCAATAWRRGIARRR
jgi:hypothetical protein